MNYQSQSDKTWRVIVIHIKYKFHEIPFISHLVMAPDGRTEGRTEGGTDRRTDGRTDGRTWTKLPSAASDGG